MIDFSRDLNEKNTHLLKDTKDLKNYPQALKIIESSGCTKEIHRK